MSKITHHRIVVFEETGLEELCTALNRQVAQRALPWQIDLQRPYPLGRQSRGWIKSSRPAAALGFFRNPETVKTLNECEIPFINLSGNAPFPGFGHSVTVDHYAVGRLAARWFLDRGFRHFLTQYPGKESKDPGSETTSAFDRVTGFTQTLAAAGHRCSFTYGSTFKAKNKNYLRCLANYLEELPKPLGCFWFTDRLAVTWMLAAPLAEIRIPQDVSMIGADNNVSFCQSVQPSLSSIAMPWTDIARNCVDVLLSMLYGRDECTPAKIRCIPRRIIERESIQAAIVDKRLRKAVQFLQRKMTKPVKFSDVARHCGISNTRLYQLFNQELAMPPQRWLQKQRIFQAKRMLEETTDAIAAIATACGYNSYQQFFKAFTKECGCSPTAWREHSRA